MNSKFHLADAANVIVPAYLALIQKGFTVRRQSLHESEDELWYAEDDTRTFIANGPVELLGLISVHETRGDFWSASDEEIDSFLKDFA